MLQEERNPWLGLASYEYEDAYRFFGREMELAELKTAICNNLFTTIYGISGAGKTSLINAGMIPLLEKDSYLPVRIRLDHQSEVGYNSQIVNAVMSAIEEKKGDIESVNVLEEEEIAEKERLWNLLYTSKIWSQTNHQITPVVIIDQFEEIFTKNDKDEPIHDFFETINSLQYNNPPSFTSTCLTRHEKYIDYNDTAQFRMVFIMREDFLARLEDYSFNIPALRKNRNGIKRMNGFQALEVIQKPMPNIVDRNVALKIIEKVTGKAINDTNKELSRLSVDTSILSLFCSELYQKAANAKLDVLTKEIVNQFGDNIIHSFYDETMRLVSHSTMEYLETHLLTHSGFRNSVALEDILQNGIRHEELDKLSNKRLIRIETFDSTERVEFTHDVICRIAKEHRNKRYEKANNRAIIWRNMGFVVDTTALTIMLLIVLLYFFWGGQFYRAIIHWEVFLVGFLSYLLLPYRHLYRKNAKWILLLASLIFLFTILSHIPSEDTGTMTGTLTEDTIERYGVLLGGTLILPIIRFLQSLRYSKRQSMIGTIREVATGEVYAQYPFFGKYLGILTVMTIIICAFIIGASLHDFATWVSMPLFSLCVFFIILYEFGLKPKNKSTILIKIGISILLLLMMLYLQYCCHHTVPYCCLCCGLLISTIWYIQKCELTHVDEWFESKGFRNTNLIHYGIALALWGIAFVFIPRQTLGYNILKLGEYARVYNGTIYSNNKWQSHPYYRFMTIRDREGNLGVRDRQSVIIPPQYTGVSNYCLFDVRERTFRYEFLAIGQDDANIVFSVKKEGKDSYWSCADHLDMDNICTRLIVDNYKRSGTAQGCLNYIKYLKNNRNYSQKQIEKDVTHFFIDAFNNNGSRHGGHISQFNELRGSYSIIYSDKIREILHSLSPLLAYDKSHELSRLLLDTLLVEYKKDYSGMNSYYIAQSYYHLFSRDFVTAEKESLMAIRNDSTESIAYTNLFWALLFQGKEEDAYNLLSKHKNDLYSINRGDDILYKYVGMGCLHDLNVFTECELINDLSKSQQERVKDSLQAYQLPEGFDNIDGGNIFQVNGTKESANYLLFQLGTGESIIYYEGKAISSVFQFVAYNQSNDMYQDDETIVAYPLELHKRKYAFGTNCFYKKTGKRYYIVLNSSGTSYQIEGPFNHAWFFSENMAAVDVDGKIGFIDRRGSYVIPPKFEYDYDNAKPCDIVDFVFHDGYCPMVASPGKHGLIDKHGNWVIKPEYKYINNPVDGYRIIRKGNQYGLLNTHLKLVLPIEHNFINQDKDSHIIQIDNSVYSYPELKKVLMD